MSSSEHVTTLFEFSVCHCHCVLGCEIYGIPPVEALRSNGDMNGVGNFATNTKKENRIIFYFLFFTYIVVEYTCFHVSSAY